MAVTLDIGNDNLIKLTGLKNAASGGSYENAATVSAQVKDLDGNNIGSAVTLLYVAGSNGNYEGTIPDTLSILANTFYKVEVSADAGAGKKALWTEKVLAKVRDF